MDVDDVIRILTGDCRDVLKTMPDASVQCCVTSPPYYGLRDYGTAQWEGGDAECDHVAPNGQGATGQRADRTFTANQPYRDLCGKCGARRIDSQIGLEQTPAEYVAQLVEVFREVRRVLRPDGVLFLNLGDSYAGHNPTGFRAGNEAKNGGNSNKNGVGKIPGLKPKDLIGIPWMVAFALREDGWWLRQDNIWAKRNCLSGGTWLYAKTAGSIGPMMLKDLVRLRPENVKLWNGSQWTQVTAWHEHADRDGATELVLRSGERIGCTADHIWPTQRGELPTSLLRVGDRLLHCRLPDPQRDDDWLTADAFWFAGLFLAEGHRSKVARAEMITISGHVKESARIERLSRVARHYGASLAVHDTAGNAQVAVIHGHALSAVLDTLISGDSAHTKRLAAKAWQFSNGALRNLAEGYLHGDGAPDGTRVRLGFCRNYDLERDLRCLAARLGATLTLKPNVAKNQHGQFPSFRGEWRWDRSGHPNEKDRGEIVALRQSRARKFWDITVADHPHLFALASGLLTHNCMPESVRDRTTRAHEYVFMLTKSERYFYDSVAIEEEGEIAAGTRAAKGSVERAEQANSRPPEYAVYTGKRNKRSIWWVATQPFPEAHFATFPPDLIEPCILAGTSEKGCCSACGAPWVRQTEKQTAFTSGSGRAGNTPVGKYEGTEQAVSGTYDVRMGPSVTTITTGWTPSCRCNAGVVPCTVIDPFGGAGTSALVADRLGRGAVIIELNPSYAEMARNRVVRDAGLFAEVAK